MKWLLFMLFIFLVSCGGISSTPANTTEPYDETDYHYDEDFHTIVPDADSSIAITPEYDENEEKCILKKTSSAFEVTGIRIKKSSIIGVLSIDDSHFVAYGGTIANSEQNIPTIPFLRFFNGKQLENEVLFKDLPNWFGTYLYRKGESLYFFLGNEFDIKVLQTDLRGNIRKKLNFHIQFPVEIDVSQYDYIVSLPMQALVVGNKFVIMNLIVFFQGIDVFGLPLGLNFDSNGNQLWLENLEHPMDESKGFFFTAWHVLNDDEFLGIGVINNPQADKDLEDIGYRFTGRFSANGVDPLKINYNISSMREIINYVDFSRPLSSERKYLGTGYAHKDQKIVPILATIDFSEDSYSIHPLNFPYSATGDWVTDTENYLLLTGSLRDNGNFFAIIDKRDFSLKKEMRIECDSCEDSPEIFPHMSAKLSDYIVRVVNCENEESILLFAKLPLSP